MLKPATLALLPQVDTRLDTVRVELYNTYDDKVRFFMEIVLNIMIGSMFLYSCYQVSRGEDKYPHLKTPTSTP